MIRVDSLPVALPILLAVSSFSVAEEPAELRLVDSRATAETRELLLKLHKQAGHGVLFGQPDATAYGVGWWDQAGRCDLKEVSGQWPAGCRHANR